MYMSKLKDYESRRLYEIGHVGEKNVSREFIRMIKVKTVNRHLFER